MTKTARGHLFANAPALYGLAQNPRNYSLYTKEKLIKMGFYQSDADPCLFISKDVIVLVYVDKALYFFKDKEAMLDLKIKMVDEGMLFREEDSVAGYLGVHIVCKKDNSIVLTQSGLAKRIIDALHLNDNTIDPVDAPCTKYLAIDEGGELAHGDFEYRSIVEQLNYLQGHSRPDITMAVSQCARFEHLPKHSHELALLCIGQYLEGTSEQGLILRPKEAYLLKTDVYVGASFSCGWGVESSANPNCIKSCTGYIIKIASCPVLWVFVMQTTITTSTMESKYSALSQAC